MKLIIKNGKKLVVRRAVNHYEMLWGEIKITYFDATTECVLLGSRDVNIEIDMEE